MFVARLRGVLYRCHCNVREIFCTACLLYKFSIGVIATCDRALHECLLHGCVEFSIGVIARCERFFAPRVCCISSLSVSLQRVKDFCARVSCSYGSRRVGRVGGYRIHDTPQRCLPSLRPGAQTCRTCHVKKLYIFLYFL